MRVRSGVYKDDLAKVISVDHSSNEVSIRLIPRLDYREMGERRTSGVKTAFGRVIDPSTGKVKAVARPAPR